VRILLCKYAVGIDGTLKNPCEMEILMELLPLAESGCNISLSEASGAMGALGASWVPQNSYSGSHAEVV